ncbi:MAG: ABC transporter permease [Vulcanimicrobiota bacterium]
MKKEVNQKINIFSSVGRRRELLFQVTFYVLLMLFVGGLASLFLATVLYIDWETFKASVLDPEIQFSVKLSLITASITTVLAVLLGIPVSYALSRFKIPGKNIVDTIIDFPIVLPPAVVGICLLILFRYPIMQKMQDLSGIEFVYSQPGIVLAQFSIAASFGIRSIKAAFDSINPRFEQVARTLGCSPSKAFWKVTLPLAKDGIIAGIVVTWARAIAEFGPILFFCGATRMKTDVMPVAIFLNISIGHIEMAVAICILMMITSGFTLILFKKLGGKGYVW